MLHRKRQILVLALIAIMALLAIAPVAAATQTQVSHCTQVDLGGGVFSTTCSPQVPASGWNCVPGPLVVVNPTTSTFDVVCSRDVADAPPPPEVSEQVLKALNSDGLPFFDGLATWTLRVGGDERFLHRVEESGKASEWLLGDEVGNESAVCKDNYTDPGQATVFNADC